jgi:hypothetical protein
MTTLEPYLKGSSEKDDQDITYNVFLIYRTLLAHTQLTFQPDFLGRTMITIASSMNSVSLKVIRNRSFLMLAFERRRACSLSHRKEIE